MKKLKVNKKIKSGRRDFYAKSRLYGKKSKSAVTKKRLADRRRLRRIRFTFLFIFILIVVLVAFVWGSHLNRFEIQKIIVSGTRELNGEIIEDFVNSKLNDGKVHLLSRKNMFLYPKKEILSSIISSFPRVSSSKIKIISLTDPILFVSIVEREPFAIWCSNTIKCYFMDKDGVIFDDATGFKTENVYVFKGGVGFDNPLGKSFLPTRFKEYVELIEWFKVAGVQVIAFTVLNEHDFEIQTDIGMKIKASFEQNRKDIIDNLKVALRSNVLRNDLDKVEYIDLRFGNRVYFKMKK